MNKQNALSGSGKGGILLIDFRLLLRLPPVPRNTHSTGLLDGAGQRGRAREVKGGECHEASDDTQGDFFVKRILVPRTHYHFRDGKWQ